MVHVLVGDTSLKTEYLDALQSRAIAGLQLHSDYESSPLDQIEVVIAWSLPHDWQRRLPRVRWVQSTGVGVDALLGSGPWPAHVILTRVGPSDVTARKVAEYVLAYVLAGVRELFQYKVAQDASLWQPRPVRMLRGARIGVVGYGRLGTEIASILKGVGADIVVLRRRVRGDENDAVRSVDDADDFFRDLDVVVVCAPSTPGTQRVVNEGRLALVRQGALLINVSRAALLDDVAVMNALDSGRLTLAVLDVFDVEPLPQDSPLWRHDKVIVTPHVAGETNVTEAAKEFAENLQRFRSGAPLRYPVEPERGY